MYAISLNPFLFPSTVKENKMHLGFNIFIMCQPSAYLTRLNSFSEPCTVHAVS